MRFKLSFFIGIIFLCSSVLALAALDLRFTTAISQSPDPANTGDTVSFVVSFITSGGVVDNLKITGGVDGATLFTRTYAHIDADKGRTDTFSWTATAGAHTAWFELDPDHTAGDSNYANNRVEKAFTVGSIQGKPNLMPIVDYSPKGFNSGNSITFTIAVQNNGNAASVPCKITIMQGATLLQELNIPAIAAGATSPSQTYSWTVVCNAIIKIQVDSDSQNIESNENDNTWSRGMQCSGDPTSKPNLTLRVGNIPICLKAGNTVTFVIWVKNKGKAASVPCKMTVKEGTALKQELNIPALNAGGSFSKHIYSWTAVCNAVINIEVDSNFINDESNENDNAWSKEMPCGPCKPNLTPIISINPTKFKKGDILTLGISVKNTGDAPSVPCDIRITENYPEKGYIYKMPDRIPAISVNSTYVKWYRRELIACDVSFTVDVDTDFKNDELDETDNTTVIKKKCEWNIWDTGPAAGNK